MFKNIINAQSLFFFIFRILFITVLFNVSAN